ncbi:MAG: YfhO family protein [Vicinamibacteria bacterium]
MLAEPTSRRTRLLVALVLALEAGLLLGPAAVGGQVFFRRDVHLMGLAQTQAYARAWADGGWPLWNPLASFGQALLADANAQVLYPFSLLRLVTEPWTYYTLYAFSHLLLAGAGAAFLARRLGLRPLAAAGAGGLWMASGPLLSVIDTWNQLAGAAWMPWAIAAGLAVVSGRSRRWALAWATVTALQVLAGAPEMVLLSAAGLAVLAAARPEAAAPDWTALRRTAAALAAAAVLALGLSAAQWVPALDAAQRAGRTRLPWEARVHWSIHPANLAQAVCPVPLHRLALTGEARQRLFGAPDPFLPSVYLGAASALLVAAAWTRRSRLTVALAVLGILAGLVSMGRYAGLYAVLAGAIPPLQAFRYPAKAMLLGSLAWCLLCGSGMAALAEARPRKAWWLAAAGVGLVPLIAAVGLASGARALMEGILVDRGGALQALGLRVGLASALAGLACLLPFHRAGSARAGAAAALALLDLVIAHHDLNPTAPVALYTHAPPALASARDPDGGRLHTVDYFEPGAAMRDLGRAVPYLLARAPVGWDLRAAQALALRQALFQPSPAAWGAEGSYERDVPGLEPRPLALLKEAFRGARSEADRSRLLRIGGVSRVAALHEGAGDGRRPLARYEGLFVDPVLVFDVPGARPRVWASGGARVEPDDAAALRAILSPAFDEEREIVVAEGTGARAPVSFAGSVTVRERRGDRLLLAASLSDPGWVVVVDAWDPGWHARVDGHPAPLQRANLAFRAVPVPAGVHTVELLFRPRWLTAALSVSLASLLVLATGLAITPGRTRKALP